MMKKIKLLQELRNLINEKYPDIVDRVILFGSRIRDIPDKSSDYDILIILKTNFDWELEKEIQDLCWEIDYKYDILTDVKIYSLDDLNTIRGKQLFIINALNEGIAV